MRLKTVMTKMNLPVNGLGMSTLMNTNAVRGTVTTRDRVDPSKTTGCRKGSVELVFVLF